MASSSSKGSRPMSTEKGERKETVSVQIAYLETDFVCSSPIIAGDLSGSLKAAAAHGVQEAAKELRLPKKLLHARAIGPLEKEDGSPYSVEEWADRFIVVVEPSPTGGLAGKVKRQDALISQLVTQGVETVSLSPREVEVDSGLRLENEELKKENALLKGRIFELQEEIQKLTNDLSVKQAQVSASKLEQELSSALLSSVDKLRAEKDLLVTENKSLKERVTSLEKEVEDLKREVVDLKQKVDDLEQEVVSLKAALSKFDGWELVLIRKMLDECRTKCRAILATSNMQVADDWILVCQDPAVVSVLQANGLSIGLMSTMYGVNTPQYWGSRAAHDITEGLDVYATVVCKATGAKRDRLLDVFQFVFGVSAESVEFRHGGDGL